jgi:RNA polymerase-binding transcription factor DksA
MDLATQLHLKPLRQALEFRLHELSTRLHASDLARHAGSQAVPQAHAGAREQQRIDEAMLIQAALRRLDEGSYGDCQACGQPIALSRLQLHPEAQRCAPCETVSGAPAAPRAPG